MLPFNYQGENPLKNKPNGLNVFTGKEAFFITAVIQRASILGNDTNDEAINELVVDTWGSSETVDTYVVDRRLGRIDILRTLFMATCENLSQFELDTLIDAIADKIGR